MLSGSYRRTDANDPDMYIAAIAAVLAMYDVDLIREVTDPRTGIGTTEKYAGFMPNAGELKLYCEARAAHKERMKRLGDLPKPNFNQARLAPPEAPAGYLANIFVPSDHSRYARLVEWAKTADVRLWKFGKASDGREGIWVDYKTWDDGQKAMRPKNEPAPVNLAEHYAKFSLAFQPKPKPERGLSDDDDSEAVG